MRNHQCTSNELGVGLVVSEFFESGASDGPLGIASLLTSSHIIALIMLSR